jgi:hypothetical protein
MTPNNPGSPPSKKPPPDSGGILGNYFGTPEWRAERMFDDRIAMLKRAIPARIVGDFDPECPQ